MVKSGVKVSGPARASTAVLKPVVPSPATRDPLVASNAAYVPATPAVYSMAWIYQLEVARPLNGLDPNNVFCKVKVGAESVDQTTQVHLLFGVIPDCGMATTQEVAPAFNSVATIGSVTATVALKP